MNIISDQTVKQYCDHLVDKVFNLLILKEKNKDIIKPIDKIVKELKGSTLSEIKPFADNQYVLEIIFLISGLKEEIEISLCKTIIFDCCNKINLLPQKLQK